MQLLNRKILGTVLGNGAGAPSTVVGAASAKINEKKVSNIESAKDSLLKIILDLEEESNNIEKSVNDLTSRIDKLKINEKELFADLRKNYQNLTNEEIRNQIHKYIDKKLSIKPNKET